ncbi:MAG: hypothetical protein RL885_15880 [Planctomycetota bacterium]
MTLSEQRQLQESFELTAANAAAALASTVLRAQVEAARNPGQGGVLGGLQRADRALESVQRWVLRIVLSGVPLIVGVALLVFTSFTMLGVLALIASIVLWAVVSGIERLMEGVGRSVDAMTDPVIARSGGARLQSAIETGKVRVLTGRLRLELSGDRLRVESDAGVVTIPSISAAWKDRAPGYLVLLPQAPGAHPDFGSSVIIPADGTIAKVVEAESPLLGAG